MIIKDEGQNKKIHGLLGLTLNAFYFFVGVHYITNCHTTDNLWYIALGIVFVIYLGYCYTFGVKWEMKHIQANSEKISTLEKKIATMEKEINSLREELDADTVEEAEMEGFEFVKH